MIKAYLITVLCCGLVACSKAEPPPPCKFEYPKIKQITTDDLGYMHGLTEEGCVYLMVTCWNPKGRGWVKVSCPKESAVSCSQDQTP